MSRLTPNKHTHFQKGMFPDNKFREQPIAQQNISNS